MVHQTDKNMLLIHTDFDTNHEFPLLFDALLGVVMLAIESPNFNGTAKNDTLTVLRLAKNLIPSHVQTVCAFNQIAAVETSQF